MSLPKLIHILVDGLPYFLLEKCRPAALRVLPLLAGLAKAEMVHRLSPLFPNCQTPPSLFSIWSGCSITQHKISGFDVPLFDQGDPLGFSKGFEHWPQDTTMLWDRYATEGKAIRLCSVPFVQPSKLKDCLKSATNVFGNTTLDSFAACLNTSVRQSAVKLELNCRPLGLDGYIAEAITDEGNRSFLKIAKNDQWYTLPLPQFGGLSPAGLPVGVFTNKVGDKRFCGLGVAEMEVIGSESFDYERALDKQPFINGSLCKQYRNGQLGHKLIDGGDGSAEELMLSGLQKMHTSFSINIRQAIRLGGSDLVVAYYPVMDLFLHESIAWLTHPRYRSEDFFRQTVDRLMLTPLVWLDGLLAQINTIAGDEYSIIASSDHGMIPVTLKFHLNVLFQKLGWLSRQPDGIISPQTSLCYYHPAENGLVIFNMKRLNATTNTTENVFKSIQSVLDGLGHTDMKILDGGYDFAAKTGLYSGRYFFQPPENVRAKADLDVPLLCANKKAGDHTVYRDNNMLDGILIEMGQPLPADKTPWRTKISTHITDMFAEL